MWFILPGIFWNYTVKCNVMWWCFFTLEFMTILIHFLLNVIKVVIKYKKSHPSKRMHSYLAFLCNGSFFKIRIVTSKQTVSHLSHPPFSSLSSFSAKILHLRSYLSCACSCSIFMRRLTVSVLMPGLEAISSSNSMASCCEIRNTQTIPTCGDVNSGWFLLYMFKSRFLTSLLGKGE